MDLEAHRAHQLSRPAREGLAELAREVAPGSRAVRVRRLGGGLGTATHSLDLEARTGSVMRLVLKRYREDDGAAKSEWERLKFAHVLPVPSPEPVAHDAGEWFGAPALVMSRLKGHPSVMPEHLDPWLAEIAKALVAIQDHPMRKAPAVLRRPHWVEGWEPPDDLRRSKLVGRAIDAIREGLPEALGSRRAIGHGDYHPGNLVWSRNKLTGVVDWSMTRISPRAYEVGYCRTDLTVLIGAEAAERFRRAYEEVCGESLGEELFVWDLVCSLNALRSGRFWVGAYREQGKKNLTARHVWPRVSVLMRRALAQLT
ncbi:MAG: aminoglycoside phosphotransferase family protein [Actinobacteria bacterium]|nr:aminoglycoside phosphotransferase family protein [Actinomycetota bacterium]